MRSDLRDLPSATGRARLLRYLSSPLLPRSLAVVAFLVMFALPFRGFLRPAPFQTAPALAQSALVADALSAEPSQTPLVLVADNASAGIVTAYANALRDAVAPTSAPDVYVFMGGPQDLEAGKPRITGSPEHDRLALETWQSIRPLLGGSPLIVALESFDPRAYRATLALPGRQVIGDGVVALPGYGPIGQIGSSQPSLVGPWLPVFLAPALLVILGILGWPWTGLLLARDVRSTRLALAPSLGLGGIVVSSVLVDLAGIRLASGGALAAVGVTAVGGLVAYAFFARRST
jgi:hypothetical protein